MRAMTKATLKSTEVAVHKPEDFVRHGNIGIQDMEIPVLKLLQGLSPEVKAHHHLRAGNWYHTILERDLGPVIPAVIVEMVHRSVDLWTPKDVRGVESKLLARAADGEHWDRPGQRFDVQLANGKTVEWATGPSVSASGLLNWGSSDPSNTNSTGVPPAATLVYTLILRVIEPDGISAPCVYTPSKMARKAVMRLNSRIDMRMGNTPPLKQLFQLSCVEKSGRMPGVSWFEPEFTSAGELKDAELFERIKAEAARFAHHYHDIKPVGDVVDADDLAGANNAAF